MTSSQPRRLLPSVLVAAIISGCGWSDGPDDIAPVPPSSDGAVVLHRGNGSEPKTLNVVHVDETVGSTVVMDLYDGLLRTDADARLGPGVAESWDVSEDGMTYLFHLRDDSRWSNGEPVVAEDFAAALRRYVDPKIASENVQFFYPISNAREIVLGNLPVEALGVAALDDRTLEVRLEQPTPWFLSMMATRYGFPIHRPSIEEYGEAYARPGTLIGNGPYMLAEWVMQSHIMLERNPYHPGADRSDIDRVFFYPTEDISSEFKRYRAGELHYTREVPKQQIRWIRDRMTDHLRSGPYLGVYFLPMDNTEPPFDDIRLRKALSMAVDRNILAEKVAGAGEVPAEGLVPSYVSDYPSPRYDWLEWPMEKRLSEARRLYAEAGYGPDHPLEFSLYYNTSQNNKRITLAVAAMWKQSLGARVSILNQEWKVYLQTRKFPGQWDMIRMGWIGGWDDPNSFLEVMLTGSDFNDAGFSDPEYDRMVAEANRMTDPAVRALALAAAEMRMLDQYPIIPLFYYATNRLVRPEVAGYRINILDRDPSAFYALGLAP